MYLDKKKKGIIIFLSIFLTSILGITIFLSVILNATSLGVKGYVTTERKYSSVLADIENITSANPRYVDIACLGSHDAHTSDLMKKGPIDYASHGTALDKVMPIVKGISYRFGVTQAVGLYEQLMQGTRFFHIKFTDYKGTWYTSHTTLCGKLEEKIKDVLKFLNARAKEGKGEIVTLFLHTVYIDKNNDLYTFHKWLKTVTVNGKSIYDYVYYDKNANLGNLKYNDLTKSGTTSGVVLFEVKSDRGDTSHWVRNKDKDELSYFFDIGKNTHDKWHNKIDSDELIVDIDNNAKEILKNDTLKDKLRINQTQAAFVVHNAGDVFRAINNWSLLKIATRHNAKLIDDKKFFTWLKAMPVFQVDFVNSNYGDFNNKVNKKILEYNTKLVQDLLP